MLDVECIIKQCVKIDQPYHTYFARATKLILNLSIVREVTQEEIFIKLKFRI